jgi:protein-L-isoaspartate O-methyltransferase
MTPALAWRRRRLPAIGSCFRASSDASVRARSGRTTATSLKQERGVVEIDAATLAFACENLERAGYSDVVLIHGDGGLGDPEHAPYDRICVMAACPDVPAPLIEHLATPGRLIAPVLEGRRQRLTLLEKTAGGVRRTSLANVLYVSLQGRYGVGGDPRS